MPLCKWIIEQNSRLIYLSVGPAVRPGSLEMAPNQGATAHLQRVPGTETGRNPATPLRLSLEKLFPP